MKVAFRVDASIEIGLGHVKRCLSLARALSALGVSSVFVARDLGVDISFIADAGFELLCLPAPDTDFFPSPSDPAHSRWAGVPAESDAKETVSLLRDRALSWVVVDHYSLDIRWHRVVVDALRVKIAVIDDLADRPLDADLLIDHNLTNDHDRKYASTGSRIGRLLGGPRYALLDPTYRSARRDTHCDTVRSVGIFLGGTDPHEVSVIALKALRQYGGFHGPVEIATTSSNPNLKALRASCEDDANTKLLVDQRNLQDFYLNHDLHIGAGGGAALERCCVGTPTLLLSLAVNQRAVAEVLHKLGAVHWVDSVEPIGIGRAFAQLTADPAARRRMSAAGQALVDGLGARRVATTIAAAGLVLRTATEADARPCHAWRNSEVARRYSRDSFPLELADHLAWWQLTLSDPKRSLLIAQIGDESVGVIRLDWDGAIAEISIYTDPTLTGLGLGRRMLDEAARWALRVVRRARRFVADIDPNNRASQAAFLASGFCQVGPRSWTRDLQT